MEVAVALALLFFCVLLLASGAIAFLLIRHCLAALRRRPSADADPEARAPAAAAPRHRQPQPAAAAAKPKQQQALLIAVKKEAQQQQQAPRRLAWREVEALTGGFDEATVVGRGGSSTVYLARLLDGSPVAVKVHRWCGGERRLRAFRQELDLLRRLRHPNIVALLAYSDDHEEEGALVLEYLAGGTLADALHGSAAGTAPLSWAQRMRILHDVACALEHLHDGGGGGTSTAVVHGDVSASNVLLDGATGGGARLCDLGSACEGFSAAVAPARAAVAVGSPGYADPFFLRTGIVSSKSDVYGFGVLLLEAVTGLPAAGGGAASEIENLTARILPRVRARGVAGLVDASLGEGGYDEEEAADVARLAVECVAAQPGLRPSMAQVRAAIAEKAARSIAKAGYGHHIQLSKLLELT
ncbi:salt tolerance receptor-like cytoplasmic kinase 1 [Miscanthus floridulus]|uniref:salt tolerance receptor-like cytoplasmic kinase 1 n=1 Tax=Miscanthus floridulus TaxID=154761 RepID=UPI003459285C